ncbi:MAG: phosphoribosyltransferase family protein [Patescibacteria group bacterium]
MLEHEVTEILGKVGAFTVGDHIVYTSGRHGTSYVNKDAIYPHIEETSLLCRAIAEQFADDRVQVVIAPAIGGVILSQWTAHHLTEMLGHRVLAVYAEKAEDGKTFIIKRGYDQLIAGKNVLVVEDILTTGGSAKKVIEATRAIGGHVVGLGVLCNRGDVTPSDVADVPKLIALLNMQLVTYDESTCPLCEQNIPINMDLGKGREFRARQST